MRAAGNACLVNPLWGEWSAPVEFGKNKSMPWATLPPAMSCLPHTLPCTYGHTDVQRIGKRFASHQATEKSRKRLNTFLNILTLEITLKTYTFAAVVSSCLLQGVDK